MKINKLVLAALSSAFILQVNASHAVVIDGEDQVWNTVTRDANYRESYWGQVRDITDADSTVREHRERKRLELPPLQRDEEIARHNLWSIEQAYNPKIQALEEQMYALAEQRVAQAKARRDRALAELDLLFDRQFADMEAKLEQAKAVYAEKIKSLCDELAIINRKMNEFTEGSMGPMWNGTVSRDLAISFGVQRQKIYALRKELGIAELERRIYDPRQTYFEKTAAPRQAIEAQFEVDKVIMSPQERDIQGQIDRLKADAAKEGSPFAEKLAAAEAKINQLRTLYSDAYEAARDKARRQVTDMLLGRAQAPVAAAAAAPRPAAGGVQAE